MKRLRVILWIVVVALVGMIIYFSATQIIASANSFHGSAIEPSPPAYAFSLEAADGSNFDLSRERGKVVLIYFGYTNCPDFCPATMTKYQSIFTRLGDSAGGVDFVFISVDPARDTPVIAEQYVHNVNGSFIGLSGTEDELRPIWQNYYVNPQIGPVEGDPLSYTVAHTTRVYVIDKQGNLRLTFPFEMEAEDMAHDVSLLLAEN